MSFGNGLPTTRRKLLPRSCTMNMEAAGSSLTPSNGFSTRQRHITQDNNDNLKTHTHTHLRTSFRWTNLSISICCSFYILVMNITWIRIGRITWPLYVQYNCSVFFTWINIVQCAAPLTTRYYCAVFQFARGSERVNILSDTDVACLATALILC